MNEKVILQNGVEMPRLGFGTYKHAPEQESMNRAVRNGLNAGFRSIDTAEHYGNEAMVGEAIRCSGYKREELFLTTKIWNTDHGYHRTLEAFEESAERLKTYPDLLLIHWPCPMMNKYIETWQALQELYRQKKIRAIGVSNFKISHLEQLRKAGGVQPMVNKIEMQPYFIKKDMLEYCRKRKIFVSAWSPFLRGKNIAEHKEIEIIASAHGKSPAQIVLRYLMELGAGITVKTASYEHARSNLEIYDFCLEKPEMDILDGLNTGKRVYQDPDEYYL